MVGGVDNRDIEILLGQEFAIVAIEPGFLLGLLARSDEIRGLGEHFGINVAERDNLDITDLQEPIQITLAVPPATDEPDTFGFFIGSGVEARERWQNQSSGGEKITTIHKRSLA
jgi:hypothetical protein